MEASLPTRFTRLPPNVWTSRNVNQHYKKICQVGQGTYGCVSRAESLDGQKTIVALKQMQYLVSKHEQGFPITTLREIKLLQHLNHENILRIKEVLHRREASSQFPLVNICLDYMDYDLDDLIKQKNYELTIPKIRYIIRQILQGVDYLHKNNVIHRDLKAKNILVNKDGHIKVADFGLAKNIRTRRLMTIRVVTLWYRAPQILLGCNNYDYKIDVWSVGCILAELLLRHPLFEQQQNQKQIIKRIFELMGTPDTNGWDNDVKDLPIYREFRMDMPIESTFIFEMKKKCPQVEAESQLLDLMEKLLELNPYRRLSAAEALEHQFFKQNTISSSELVPQNIQQLLDTKKSSKSNAQKKHKAG